MTSPSPSPSISPPPTHNPLPLHPVLRPALKHSLSASPAPTSSSAPALLSPPLTSPLRSGSSGGNGIGFFPRSLSTASSLTTPMAGYKSGVSFDTMGESTTELFSYTLQAKSENYERSRKTRIYLCAASPDESGQEALDWSVETLAQDGDELIVLRGFDTEDAGSLAEQDLLRSQAHQLLLDILERNTQLSDGTRSLNVTVEFVAGRITDTIERLIALYRPDSLVVGTRARKGMKALGAALGAPGMGSVSRWCVSHSPVPVIVVRPERKVKKTLDKRRNDPKRAQEYEQLSEGLIRHPATGSGYVAQQAASTQPDHKP